MDSVCGSEGECYTLGDIGVFSVGDLLVRYFKAGEVTLPSGLGVD